MTWYTELTIELRGRPVLVQVRDHRIQDGDPDEPDELTFDYRVFDLDEDAEITQLSQDDQEIIFRAILTDLHTICQE